MSSTAHESWIQRQELPDGCFIVLFGPYLVKTFIIFAHMLQLAVDFHQHAAAM
jgi:hypothetical protein